MAVSRFALTLAVAAFPSLAAAHSFGRIYNLPVPFWMYAYGAAAALLLSFLIAGFFASAPESATGPVSRDISRSRFVSALRFLRIVPLLRAIGLLCLVLCLLTGFFGTRDSYRNFNMTFFWVVFVLAFAYLTALVGDLYAAINPWRTLSELIGRVWRGFVRGRLRYPPWLSYWPALALFMGFIWVELFAFVRPFTLSYWLALYTGINLVGVWLFGVEAWFRHGEFFGVFLRLLAKMAPFDYEPGRGLRLRWPFAGLVETRLQSWSLLLFVLFMLSSTAFDGLRATVAWYRIFWGDATGLLTQYLGQNPLFLFVKLRPWYMAYETAWLLLSPFLYLGVYLLFIAWSRRLGGGRHSLRELAFAFGHSLLPIALVYHVTHYYTLILTQGVKIVSLLSDPFGWGWNLFGTAGLFRAPFLPDLSWIWHTQVGLILFGHIVSVWIAHVEAMRLFPTRRDALWSQIPMLLLMVVFTTFGLWILSQPIQGL
jgi:hypothetical protein